MTYQEIVDFIASKIPSGVYDFISAKNVRDSIMAVLDHKAGGDFTVFDLEYDPQKTYNTTDPDAKYAEVELRLWKSRRDGNQGNHPPTDPDVNINYWWEEVAKAESLKPHVPGTIFGAGLALIYEEDRLWRLTVPDSQRPFQTVNFETEKAEAKWVTSTLEGHEQNTDIGLSGAITTIAQLQAITSAVLPMPLLVMFRDASSGMLRSYRLRAGTDEQVLPLIIRPDDYAPGTNERVWERAIADGEIPDFPDQVLSGLSYTRDGNDLTFAPGLKWMIDKINYQLAAEQTLTLTPIAEGFRKIVVIAANTQNELVLISGDETSSGNPVEPAIPAGHVKVLIAVVGETGIILQTPDGINIEPYEQSGTVVDWKNGINQFNESSAAINITEMLNPILYEPLTYKTTAAPSVTWPAFLKKKRGTFKPGGENIFVFHCLSVGNDPYIYYSIVNDLETDGILIDSSNRQNGYILEWNEALQVHVYVAKPTGGDGGTGEPGPKGDPGDDGREIELQKSATHIQWRYVGDASWIDLVALSELKGDKGDPGDGGGTSSGTEYRINFYNFDTFKESFFSSLTINSIKKDDAIDKVFYTKNASSEVEITFPFSGTISIADGDQVTWRIEFAGAEYQGTIEIKGS